jgi:hypothetical protein
MRMLLAKDASELAKWAHRASHLERIVKLHTARFIVRERRLRCLAVGCTNRDDPAPCARCGAR